jgi:phosphoribosylformimino-5-aminoimidazole carboxamide ribotide isomerase
MNRIYQNKIFLVIPEVKLTDGKCIFCIKGEQGTEEFYKKLAGNPIELCCMLRRENARTILLSIIDDNLNEAYLQLIVKISNAVDIPIQVSANFSDYEQCKYLLDNDILRIHINPLASFSFNSIEELIKKYKSTRINASVVTENYRLNNEKYFGVALEDYYFQLRELGFKRIVFNDIDTVKNQKEYDLDLLKDLSFKSGMDVTIYHGVTTPQDLWRVNEYLYSGIDSVILSEELYHNNFPCQKIWRIAESELER